MTEHREPLDLTTPQAQIAAHYMGHKGVQIQPHDICKLDDLPCWYFYYDLPQGELELEVFFDDAADDWKVCVTSFPVAI